MLPPFAPLVQAAAADSSGAIDIFGVHLVGLSRHSAHQLLLTAFLVAGLLVARFVVHALVQAIPRRDRGEHVRFWTTQLARLLLLVVLIVGALSIWFESPARLASVLGLVGAGVAIALQRVITSFAAYLIILRGRLFTVGDRVVIGGVRGDVVALGFMQTTVMEMGEPPDEQEAAPAMWVRARQYSGRVVRVTNDKIFDSPVYNYTRDFPYLWEEMHIPIGYKADRGTAERIILDAARKHTIRIAEMSEPAVEELRRHFFLKSSTDLEPQVYWRLTDNWIEMSVRFIAKETGVRSLKDAMSREILSGLDAAGIEIASSTYDVVGFPTVKVDVVGHESEVGERRRAS